MKNTILALTVLATASLANAGTSSGKALATPPQTPPAPACSTISYDFVEAGYGRIFGDFADANGAYATFSSTIAGNLFGFVEANQYWGENNSGDFFSADAGLGYHIPLTSCIDWVVKAALVYDSPEGGDDTFSGIAATGFRFSLGSNLEINTFYNAFWSEFEDVIHGGTLALIVRDVLAPKVDVVIAGIVTEEGEAATLGLRYNF